VPLRLRGCKCDLDEQGTRSQPAELPQRSGAATSATGADSVAEPPSACDTLDGVSQSRKQASQIGPPCGVAVCESQGAVCAQRALALHLALYAIYRSVAVRAHGNDLLLFITDGV